MQTAFYTGQPGQGHKHINLQRWRLEISNTFLHTATVVYFPETKVYRKFAANVCFCFMVSVGLTAWIILDDDNNNDASVSGDSFCISVHFTFRNSVLLRDSFTGDNEWKLQLFVFNPWDLY